MESGSDSESSGNHKDASTQTCNNIACSEINQEICRMCGKRIPSITLSNEIPVGGILPHNTCQCFFPDINIPEETREASVPNEQNTESSVQMHDSQNASNLPVKTKSSVESSNKLKVVAMDSSEEPKAPDFSHSSNGYLSTVGELPSNQLLTDPKSINSGSRDDLNSPNTECYTSSGYALSLEQSSGQNLIYNTSPSSEESRNRSNGEKCASSGYALSLREHSSDENRTNTSPSSEESRNRSHTGKGVSSGYALSLGEQSPNENQAYISPSSEESRNKSRSERGASSGYPLSLGEQSAGQSIKNFRNVTSASSGEQAKNCSNIIKNGSLRSFGGNTNSDHMNVSKYNSSESASSKRSNTNNQQTRGFSNISESMGKLTINKNKHENISTEFSEIRSDNHIRLPILRPLLPRPFPRYQPNMNPTINMPTPRPIPQPFQSCGNSATNAPTIQTELRGRFSVSSRPQMRTPYQHSDTTGNEHLSKSSLKNAQKMDSNIKKKDMIDNWLVNVEPGTNPEEGASTSNPTQTWSTTENGKSEGIPPGFSGTSTDERSSTEISEEENRRQRSLRRPPRSMKRGGHK